MIDDESLMEINIDTIRQLRRDGRGVEAEELLKAFHNNIKENKKQLNKELINQSMRVKRFLNKEQRYCVRCGFLLTPRQRKYCGVACADDARREQVRDKYWDTKKVRYCKICGAECGFGCFHFCPEHSKMSQIERNKLLKKKGGDVS